MSSVALFEVKQVDDAVLLTPQRDLTEFEFGQIESESAEIAGRLTHAANKHLIVDFTRIDYCGSTGLGVLTLFYKKVRERGGEMAICNLSGNEREVLRVTGLDRLWHVCKNVDDSLKCVHEIADAKSSNRWVLVADRAIARVYEFQLDQPLRLVKAFEHAESREKMSDEVTDGPGSFSGGGIAGAESGDPQVDHRHRTATDFARQIASFLDTACQRKEFGKLVVFAAPLFLGAFRDEITTEVSNRVEHEVDKDYTHTDVGELLEHIKTLLAA